MDIRTVLEYSPYDNKRKSPFIVDESFVSHESEFKKHFFVDYSEDIELLIDNLKMAINSESCNTILFYGASGSGKTTFLNYFAERERDNCDFHFINLIEQPASIEHEECVRKILLSNIYSILDNNDDYLTKELYKHVVLNNNIRFFNNKEDNNIIINYLGASQILKQRADIFLDYIGLNPDGSFIMGRNTNQGLLDLYLILKLIQVKITGRLSRKQAFIFDNLDEIPTQYIYRYSYKLIMSAFSEVQDFCEKHLGYDFLGNCTFILSYRSNNAQLIDRCQLEDRSILSRVNIEFRNEYQASYPKILSKRLQYYCDIINKNTLQKNDCRVRELLNSEKEFCTKVIRPLFNYDFRMFNHFFVMNLIEIEQNKISSSLIKTSEKNKEQYKHTGARGLLMFYALESLLKDPLLRFRNYVNHEFDNDSLCNIYRMAFTLLSNLGGWSLQEDNLVNAIKEENTFNDETPRISFYEFAKRVEKWYDKEMFNSVIEGLIGAVAFNFEYPITLVGGLIDDYFKDESTTHTTIALAKYIVKVYSENPSLLANVFVKINPLCVIYCWRVFIHFEYFNLISDKWQNPCQNDYRYRPMPLFEITNENMLSWCLNNVFETVKVILSKADEHFCGHCIDYKNVKCNLDKNDRNRKTKSQDEVGSSLETCKDVCQRFAEDGFCINNTMFAVRVITSHLNYLDQYKTFIWNTLDVSSDTLYKMQTRILDQMDKYLVLWRKRRVVENKQLMQKYQDNVDKARKLLDEDKKCESIELSEDFQV